MRRLRVLRQNARQDKAEGVARGTSRPPSYVSALVSEPEVYVQQTVAHSTERTAVGEPWLVYKLGDGDDLS